MKHGRECKQTCGIQNGNQNKFKGLWRKDYFIIIAHSYTVVNADMCMV